MELTIRKVDTAYVPLAWPKVEKWLDEGLTKDDDSPEWSQCYNLHHVQAFLANGSWMLLVAIDADGEIHGAATVSFATYPMQRVAFITLIGGRLVSSKDTFEQMKNILREHGATKIQGYGREAIVRLWRRFGFEPRTTLVETKL